MQTGNMFRNRIVSHGEEDPSQLLANDLNWRLHPEFQQVVVQDVLKDVGWVDEVMVNLRTSEEWPPNERNVQTVVDGHLRVILGLRNNEPTVPVKYVDLTPNEERTILAVFDASAALAATDSNILPMLVQSIESDSDSIQQLLAGMLDAMPALMEEESEAVDAEPRIDMGAELLEKWQVRRGQLWQLGRHFLLCGDSTDESTVADLMGDTKPALCFTSPPYNAGLTPTEYNQSLKLAPSERAKSKKQKYANYSDELPQDSYAQLLIQTTELALKYCALTCFNIQMLADNKIALIEWLHHLRNSIADVAIWDKQFTQPAMAPNVMNSQFEFLWFFSAEAKRQMGSKYFRGTVPNVYSAPQNRGNEYSEINSAAFPLHLPTFLITTFTNKGETIFDPFTGTGTTIIAAHNTNRTAIGIELDPVTAAVTLQRFFDATMIKPELAQ